MTRTVTALLLILHSHAYAAEATNQNYSFLASFVQMLAALSVVVGLILITKHFSEKLLKGNETTRTASRHIRLVETRAIAPKKALILIEVGGQYLLLASTETGVNLLQQVDVFEDIEVIEESCGKRPELFGLFRKHVAQRRT